MKTTLNLDDHLVREAKKRAAESGQTLTSVVEAALRDAFATSAPAPRPPLDFPAVVIGRRRPGIDPSGRGALHERMDGRR